MKRLIFLIPAFLVTAMLISVVFAAPEFRYEDSSGAITATIRNDDSRDWVGAHAPLRQFISSIIPRDFDIDVNSELIQVGNAYRFKGNHLDRARVSFNAATNVFATTSYENQDMPVDSVDWSESWEDGVFSGNPARVWVIKTNENQEILVSSEDFHCSYPLLSPDGGYVIYTRRKILDYGLGDPEICVFDVDTGLSVAIADRFHHSEDAIALKWQDTNNAIVYSYTGEAHVAKKYWRLSVESN